MKKGTVNIQPGQPLQFTDVSEAEMAPTAAASMSKTVGVTLKAYLKAARDLLEVKYVGQKPLAPKHLVQPCNVFAVRCSDGMLVRYDLPFQPQQADAKAMVRVAAADASLEEIAPKFSEQVIHFPQDPKTYLPPLGGPELILSVNSPSGGVIQEIGRYEFRLYATTKLPDEFQLPPPPMRPLCLASITNEIDLQIHGITEPIEGPVKSVSPEAQQFLVHSRVPVKVGWQAIEIYPPLGEEYWKPEYAPMWAELDILAKIAENNALTSALRAIDSRGAARKQYAVLLQEFAALLNGPEEPAHQFLKAHPELLCPTFEVYWSKLAFGKRVSDFVFREPHHDYLLVEIEAPYRELFRKDGQQREELTHAINQITDWIQHISDNREKVEQELGLAGISTNPRTLVVIGRSAGLTDENRKKIASLQALHNKLRILTYDDLIASAKANLERILGPLDIQGQNVEIYYFK